VIAVRILSGLPASRNFINRKDSQILHLVVQLVAKQRKHNSMPVVAAADIHPARAKCLTQFVQTVANRHKFRSSHLVRNRFIALIVLNNKEGDKTNLKFKIRNLK
jgi:hypothetical protein